MKLRETVICLSFLALAVLGKVGTGQAANLVSNPSAERVDAAGRPVGWGHYQNTADRWGATTEEFYTGKRCAFLRITGFGSDGYACTGLAAGTTDGYSAREGIPVEPDTTYHFSFYLYCRLRVQTKDNRPSLGVQRTGQGSRPEHQRH